MELLIGHLSKQTSIQTGTGRQSQVRYMQVGNWSSLACSLQVWDFGHMKLSTWIIILWNQVTLRTSLLAAYCTLFKMWRCWMCALKGCTQDWKKLMCTGHYSAYLMYYIIFSHDTPFRSTNCYSVRRSLLSCHIQKLREFDIWCSH